MIDIYGSAAAADPVLEVSWEDLRAGIHCAARLEGEDKWYRVVVDRVNSTTSIQVTLLDFGSLVIVPLSNLRWLLAQFCSLPAQAILAKLAGLSPPHGCSSWPQASSIRLLDLTRPACDGKDGDRGLVARVVEWGKGGKVLLRLFDTVTNTCPEGMEINKVLVEEGLARMTFIQSDDIKYLEEMLITGKSYTYAPLRCPNFLSTDQQDDVLGTGPEKEVMTSSQSWLGTGKEVMTSQSSTVSEDTSIKTQLKSLLNIQNSIHSLVSKNLVTEEGAEIFSRMTSLQSRWQALLVRLVRDTVGVGCSAGLQKIFFVRHQNFFI